MVDFPGLVTAVNNMTSWLWYMMNLYISCYRGLAIINYNLYGGMNYLFNLEFNLLTCVYLYLK